MLDEGPSSSSAEKAVMYKPTKRRIILYHLAIGLIIVPLLAGIAEIVFFKISLEHWFLETLSLLIVALLIGAFRAFYNQYDFAITIRNNEISGTTGKFYSQVTFPFEQIDKPRTARPSLTQKLLGYRYVWSISGQKIMVYIWMLKKSQVNEIFESVGCGELVLH